MSRIRVRRFTAEDIEINPLQIVSIEPYRRGMFNPFDNVGCLISLSNGTVIHAIESMDTALKLYDEAMKGK